MTFRCAASCHIMPAPASPSSSCRRSPPRGLSPTCTTWLGRLLRTQRVEARRASQGVSPTACRARGRPEHQAVSSSRRVKPRSVTALSTRWAAVTAGRTCTSLLLRRRAGRASSRVLDGSWRTTGKIVPSRPEVRGVPAWYLRAALHYETPGSCIKRGASAGWRRCARSSRGARGSVAFDTAVRRPAPLSTVTIPLYLGQLGQRAGADSRRLPPLEHLAVVSLGREREPPRHEHPQGPSRAPAAAGSRIHAPRATRHYCH